MCASLEAQIVNRSEATLVKRGWRTQSQPDWLPVLRVGDLQVLREMADMFRA